MTKKVPSVIVLMETGLDLEDFTEQEIEDEIQVLVETRQSMDADKEVPEEKEKDLMSVGTAMTATRHIRRLLQSTGAPIEVLEGFCHCSIVDND